MSAIIWSKFYWSDWSSDMAIRRCSLAARGLWMEMLCIAAQSEPYGYLAEGDKPLSAEEIAAMTGQPVKTTRRLIAELELRKVFSRDEQGRIYSRRMLREAEALQRLRSNGAKGGNPNLLKQKPAPLDNQAPIQDANQPANPQSPESNKPESSSPNAAAPRAGLTADIPPLPRPTQLPRAIAAMGTSIEAIHRKTAWMAFDYTFANWLEEGADPERDIWPTIETLSAKLGRVPASPHYFTEAIREARTRRTTFAVPQARTLAAPYRASTALVSPPQAATFTDPTLEADRLETYHRTGAWSRHWGPKPEGVDEACAQ